MRLSWAAAAGRLDLVGSSQPIKESNSLFPAGIRSRLSSSGSNCSSGSEGDPAALHAGICVRQQSVSTKDSLIAGEALSLLVTCLQLRSQQLGRQEASSLLGKRQVSVGNYVRSLVEKVVLIEMKWGESGQVGSVRIVLRMAKF